MKPEWNSSSWHVKGFGSRQKWETAWELVTVMKPFILWLQGERKKERQTNKTEEQPLLYGFLINFQVQPLLFP